MRIDIHDFRFQYRSNRVNLFIWTPLRRSQERRRMLTTLRLRAALTGVRVR